MKIRQLSYLLYISFIALTLSGCAYRAPILSNPDVALSENYTIKLLRTYQLPNQKGCYAQVVVTAPGATPIYFTLVALPDKHYAASLYLQPNNQSLQTVEQVTKFYQKQIGINGGFYNKDFAPDGLFTIKGKQLYPYLNKRVLSALVLINKQGQISLQHSTLPYPTAYYAMQTGPILTGQGKVAVHPVKQLARRNLLAITNENKLIIINTSTASLYNIANIMHDHSAYLGIGTIKMLVNLDGGRSTALYLRTANKTISIKETYFVKTMLLFQLK